MGMPGGTTDSTHPHKHRRHCGRTAPHVLLFTTQRSRLHIAQTHTRLSTATSTASTHHTPAGNTVTAQLRVRVHRVRPPPAAQHARAVVRRVQRAVRQALRLPERPDANRPDGTTPPAHSTAAKRHGRRRRLLRVLRQSVREGHREVRRRARARVCAARIALLLIVLATPAQEKYFIPSVVKEMCKTAYPIREVCSSLHTQACPCTSLRSLCCLPRCTALPYCLLFHFHCPSSSILSCVLRYIPPVFFHLFHLFFLLLSITFLLIFRSFLFISLSILPHIALCIARQLVLVKWREGVFAPLSKRFRALLSRQLDDERHESAPFSPALAEAIKHIGLSEQLAPIAHHLPHALIATPAPTPQKSSMFTRAPIAPTGCVSRTRSCTRISFSVGS